MDEEFGHVKDVCFSDFYAIGSIFVEFCFFSHLFCREGKAIFDIEFFYLTILNGFTKRDKGTPYRMDACDSVAVRSVMLHSVDFFSHCQNRVFRLSIVMYAMMVPDVAPRCALNEK